MPQPHVQAELSPPVDAPDATERPAEQNSAEPKSAERIEPMTAEAPATEDHPPPPWSGVVLRIEFRYPEKHYMGLGTGFVIRDQSGNEYLMTCAHLVNDGGWDARYRIRMRTMDHTRTIEDYGDTLHIGKSVDLQQTRGRGGPDMTQDLIVRSVAGDWMQPLRLADHDPKVGDSVWVVGCEAKDSPHNERFYPIRIVGVGRGGYTARKLGSFDPRGFSGGPVVNSAGVVVGNVLVGSESTVGGSVVSAIRRHLAEHDIAPE
jgi:S1-C subfamily serine protease